MKKESNITTAANSKSMNAIENVKLFAAADEIDSAISSTSADKYIVKANLPENKNSLKNRARQKNIHSKKNNITEIK